MAQEVGGPNLERLAVDGPKGRLTSKRGNGNLYAVPKLFANTKSSGSAVRTARPCACLLPPPLLPSLLSRDEVSAREKKSSCFCFNLMQEHRANVKRKRNRTRTNYGRGHFGSRLLSVSLGPSAKKLKSHPPPSGHV